MRDGKVAIVACTGMGKTLASVGRHAALLLTREMRVDDTVNVCLPCVAGKQDEAVDLVKSHPAIAIDGCAETCALKLLEQVGGVNIIDHLKVWRVMANHKGLKPESRSRIGPSGIELAGHVARAASDAIDKYNETTT